MLPNVDSPCVKAVRLDTSEGDHPRASLTHTQSHVNTSLHLPIRLRPDPTSVQQLTFPTSQPPLLLMHLFLLHIPLTSTLTVFLLHSVIDKIMVLPSGICCARSSPPLVFSQRLCCFCCHPWSRVSIRLSSPFAFLNSLLSALMHNRCFSFPTCLY
jgi:hypothetical protein